MRLAKTKNAVRNIFFGAVFKIITLLGPFIIRTMILWIMGSEYIGLNSLFTSILSFLSLAELGVGSALVYSMYKPIAEDDQDMICALLNLYRKMYRIIGMIILGVGLLLLPFLNKLVKGEAPADVNLYILYLIYLFNTVISYVMFAYKQSLLTAFQRSDIISKRSAVIQLLMYIFQIGALYIFRNYYWYIIWLPVFTIVTNLANAIIVDKMFPQYKCRGKVSKEQSQQILKKILALFGTKANSIVMHAADSIVISAFLGLVIVGQYGNYYYIMSALIGIMTIVYESLTAGLGNSLETDTSDVIYNRFQIITLLNAWLSTFCSVCLLCMFQPFIEIWVKHENLLALSTVVLLVVYFYVYQVRRVILLYKDAAGVWWEDRFRPYVMIVVNVVSNLILVQFIGLNGVVISTILSMLISVPWENYTVFKYVFKRSSGRYYFFILAESILCGLLCAVMWFICRNIPVNIVGLAIRLVFCCFVPNVLFILVHLRSKPFLDSIKFIGSKIKHKNQA